jgi:hypothetical protein
MKYRDHRGELRESMETVQEFTSKKNLLEHLNGQRYGDIIEDLSFEHTIYDPRTGWDTYYVVAHTKRGAYYVGMSDSDNFDLEPQPLK